MEKDGIAEDDVSFEVGRKEDGSLWTATITCKAGLSEMEFAAALKSLADDIFTGKVNFDDAPDVDQH